MRIAIVGAGKVGRALYRAARAAGATRVTLRAARKGLPRKRPSERLNEVLASLGLEEMGERFFTPPATP